GGGRGSTEKLEWGGKLVGEVVQHHQVTHASVLVSPDYLKLRQVLTEALRPFPPAALAVGKALHQLEAEAARDIEQRATDGKRPLVIEHDAGEEWQRAAIRSQSRRQLWLCHRQAGKSTTAALKALAKATSSPGSLVLLISPSQRQSAELLRKVVELHGRIAGLPKPVFVSLHRLEFEPEVAGRILSLPSSEGTVRGYSRVSLAVLDEASRIPDPIVAAVKPMLAVSAGELVALSTPNGEVGWFFEQWTRGGDIWER